MFLKQLLVVLLLTLPAVAQSVSPLLFNDMNWRLIGPFRAGRAVAVSGIPGDPNTFYFGAVDGGVWKTSNAGVTWKPIFDHEPVASIGALALAPANSKVIYVGTGESDIRSNLASGNGVYKSIDGGETWKNVGLKETRQISKIVVDSANPDIVFVGALGHAYGPNEDRGVFKSADGGATWKRVLYQGPELGVADMAIASAKPKLLFATLWNAHRPPWSTYGPLPGHGSGLYRSEDGGETWQPCVGHGLPEGIWGRSGVAVSADGERVYALVEAGKSGLYVSNDGGSNWSLQNADERLTSRAWYFSRITVDPNDADVIYVPNVALMGSRDGGKTVFVVRGAPGGDDYHELWVDPKDSSRLILGVDQGTTISVDRGKTWSSWYNQPTAQLYHVTTDDQFPYAVYGAQQDSGAAAVYSRTDHQQITPRDWFPASGSESGYIAVDPLDPNFLYVSGGYGTVQRWDRRRSLAQDISPSPFPVFGSEIATRKYRDPWTPPLVFSPVEKTALYLGTQYVMKTTDGGLHWAEISPDLTGARAPRVTRTVAAPATGPAASALNSLGEVERKDGPTTGNAMERGYGTLATVAPSSMEKGVIWAGSDTGVVSVTRDGGTTWTDVTPPHLQPWSRVSLIEPSHFDAAVAYAAVERHRMDDQTPYVYRTRDFGKTWQLVTKGLEAPAFVNAVREDPRQKGLLYAGTEFGVSVSFDDGEQWQPLQLNLPVTSIRDLAVHGDDLVVATHGRSFWILDNITPLRQAAHATASAPFLYQPQTTVRVDNDAFAGTPLPPEEPTAENPPDGAVLDYYLPAAAHKLELRIYDSARRLIRHFDSESAHPAALTTLPIAARWFPAPQKLQTSAGMHRFVWNLALGSSGVAEEDAPDDGEGDVPRGPKVPPGNYTAEFAVDGKQVAPATLMVTMDPRSPASAADLKQQWETSDAMFAVSLETRRALAEIASVQAQLEKVKANTKASALSASIATITAGSENTMGLSPANTALTATLHVAESSDRATPAQALDLYAEAHAAALAQIQAWESLKKGALPDLNQQLKAQGQPVITIAEIEQEVQLLMTQ